jgi:hypothetical protein
MSRDPRCWFVVALVSGAGCASAEPPTHRSPADHAAHGAADSGIVPPHQPVGPAPEASAGPIGPSVPNDAGAARADSRLDAGSASRDAPEYEVAGHRLRLVAEDATCRIEHRAARPANAQPETLALDLTPPCSWVLWNHEPGPRSGAVGIPVGAQGQPAAWRYPARNGVVAIAVIGSPPSEEQWQKRPRQRGRTCMSRIRGVMVRGTTLWIAKRAVEQFVCAGSPLDEATYGLFAHDDR